MNINSNRHSETNISEDVKLVNMELYLLIKQMDNISNEDFYNQFQKYVDKWGFIE